MTDNRWSYAVFDDWVVIYKDNLEVFQHHSPEWTSVFNWLGVDLEFLGEHDAEEWNYHFPDTRESFDEVVRTIEERDYLIAEKREQIERLMAEIKELNP